MAAGDVGKQRSGHKRVAVIQQTFSVGGGNEAVTSWMLESLKTEYQLSLITFSEVEIGSINRYYGTDLAASDFSIVHPGLPPMLQGTRKFSMLKDHLLMRFCRSMRNEFDLFISSSGGMDFGTRGMQYFCFPPASRLKSGAPVWRNIVKSAFEFLAKRTSHYSPNRMRQNISIVLSDWSGRITSDAYKLDIFEVIYPPVNAPFSCVAWRDKRDSFLCVARIVPEKRVDMIIDILKQVRARGFDVSLHVVGRPDNENYARLIKDLCEENRSWATYHGLQDRQQLADLMDECRYGLNGLADEPFGIAVAEMVKAGSIVWVPNDGGQTEIVGTAELTFNDTEEAVNKICSVLDDEAIQGRLLDHLEGQSHLFSTQEFSRRMQDAVGHFFSESLTEKVAQHSQVPRS